MRVVFVWMTKQVGAGAPYDYPYRLRRRPRVPPPTGTAWGATLVAELARRGHQATLVVIETPDYLQEFFRTPSLTEYALDAGARLVYTCTSDVVRSIVAGGNVLLVRHDYARLAEFLEGVDLSAQTAVQIICGSGVRRPVFRPPCPRYRLLANSTEEVEAYRRRFGMDAEVFLKPAPALFYEEPAEPVVKRYDVAFACWHTAEERKRFELLLAALELLDGIAGHELRVAVVGNASSHRTRLARMAGSLRHVVIDEVGMLDRAGVRHVFRQARLTVVPSNLDANPQVIAESLACDVPVACARDLTGGRFQITAGTGELFEPDAASLAQTIRTMLGRLDRYRPRAHCITPVMAAAQVEEIAAALRDG